LANNPLGDLLDLKQDISLKSRRLKYLDLSNLSMNNMPISLCKVLDLRHLNISNNKAYSWDKTYCSNSLPYLPIEFTRLVGLVKFLAFGVKLTELPDEIHHLRNLQIIDISKNNLRWLPSTIHLLPKLRLMNISDNNINMLPLYLEELKSLEHLIASHNRISELPEKLGFNSNLLTLDMYDNRLYRVQDMRLVTGLMRCDFAMNYINVESLEKDMIIKYRQMEAKLRSWNENLGEGYIVNMCNLNTRESTQRVEEYDNLNAALVSGDRSDSDWLVGGIDSETTETCKSDLEISSNMTEEENAVNSIGEINEESDQSDEWTIEDNSFDLPAKMSFRHNLERMDLELYWGKDQFCPADQHASPRNKKVLQFWEDERLNRADKVGCKATHTASYVQLTYEEPIQDQFEDAELCGDSSITRPTSSLPPSSQRIGESSWGSLFKKTDYAIFTFLS